QSYKFAKENWFLLLLFASFFAYIYSLYIIFKVLVFRLSKENLMNLKLFLIGISSIILENILNGLRGGSFHLCVSKFVIVRLITLSFNLITTILDFEGTSLYFVFIIC